MTKTTLVPLDLSLHEKQIEAFSSEATEILYGGAVGGGKSYLFRIAAITWASQIPNLNVFLFRRTYNELRKSHMEGPGGFPALLKPWVDAGFVDIVKEEIRFWNGSRIFLSHCQREDDVTKYLSTEFHVLMIDEASSFSENMYRQLRTRCRHSGLEIPAEYAGRFPRILLSSNPGGIGHQWLKSMFVDGVQDGEIRQMPPEDGNKKRQFIRALLEDNPTLMAENPGYADSLHGVGSPELVRAMRYGDWNIVAGAYFPEFQPDTHVIKPFTIPIYWNRVMGGDTGFSTPFAYLWFAIASEDYTTPNGDFIPKNAMVCYREYYGCLKKGDKWKFNVGIRLTPQEVAKNIIELENGEPTGDRVLDPSSFNHKSGPSEAETMARQGIIFRKADNTRVGRDGHRGGWMELRQRLRGGADGVPMIYFFDTCEHTIRTFPLQQHNPNNAEDMITSGEDHLMDACRYAVMARPWATPVPIKKDTRFRNPTMAELEKMMMRTERNRMPERI